MEITVQLSDSDVDVLRIWGALHLELGDDTSPENLVQCMIERVCKRKLSSLIEQYYNQLTLMDKLALFATHLKHT